MNLNQALFLGRRRLRDKAFGVSCSRYVCNTTTSIDCVSYNNIHEFGETSNDLKNIRKTSTCGAVRHSIWTLH